MALSPSYGLNSWWERPNARSCTSRRFHGRCRIAWVIRREVRGCHDRFGELPGAGQQLIGGEDLVDQSDVKGLLGVDRFAGQKCEGAALEPGQFLESHV
jgi:hypothetical protein